MAVVGLCTFISLVCLVPTLARQIRIKDYRRGMASQVLTRMQINVNVQLHKINVLCN